MTADLTESSILAALGAAEIMAYARRTDISMPAAARWYADKLHFPVFPLQMRGKRPANTHGFKEATLDLKRIYDIWRAAPECNIGVPTGAVEHGGCGYDVIDVDGDLGHSTLLDLLDDLPLVRAVAFTPGDPTEPNGAPGRHLYIDATGDGNAAGFAPGMDYRGRGGYVVAPPSMALHGVRYVWLQPPPMPGGSS